MRPYWTKQASASKTASIGIIVLLCACREDKASRDTTLPRLHDTITSLAGPWVFVLFVSGYECFNHRLLRVDATSARMLTTEEHYYECTV
jgi:hypothetical protein